MKQATHNTDLELQKLEAEYLQKQKDILLKAEILEKLPGFDPENVIVYSTGSVGFGWRNHLTKEQVKQIFAAFPMQGENYEMTFAGRDKNFMTDSPLIVKWENSHTYHHSKKFKICYPAADFNVIIEVDPSHFTEHTYYRSFQGKHKGFGRYETFNDIFIDYFYTQQYSGGYNTLYFLDGAEKHEEYINFIITGEFKYANELELNK